MIKNIVEFLNAKLTLTGYFESVYGLGELIADNEGKTSPKVYCSKGEYKELSNFDYKHGQSYWRKRGDVSISPDFNPTNVPTLVFRIPLKLVAFIPKEKTSADDMYSDDRVAQTLIKQLVNNNTGLRALVKSKRINITPVGYTTDNREILGSEYSGYEIDIRYNFTYLSIDLDIEIVATKDCIDPECDLDEDILHIFDFSKDEIIERLTATQVEDLITQLCEASDPVTVTNSNGTYNESVVCGETLILADTTVNVYVNAVLNQTGSLIAMVNNTINIS